MANDQVRMPSSMGGLVRYFDEYKSKISFKPGSIIIIAVILMILVVLLNTYGKSLLGM